MEAEVISHYMCDTPGGLCVFQDDVGWETENGLLIMKSGGYPGEDQIIFPYECENNENCFLQLSLPTGGECTDENGNIIPDVDEYLCTYMNGYWNEY